MYFAVTNTLVSIYDTFCSDQTTHVCMFLLLAGMCGIVNCRGNASVLRQTEGVGTTNMRKF